MTFPFTQQQSFQFNNSQYRGRFAPTPSGPLHFGSIVAALGSYLQAKANNGLWFVRIEDIDQPRTQAGAQTEILTALEAFGMHWDCDTQTQSDLSVSDQNCLVQSKRLCRYQQVLDYLSQLQLVYPCQCNRKIIQANNGLHLANCRGLNLPKQDHSIRVHLQQAVASFVDPTFGEINVDSAFAQDDFIVKRRDGLFAYQLVVVIDDIDQGITEVVRGADIMELTVRQLSLFKLFGITPPNYVHLPLATSASGLKLSKQNHAKAIDYKKPQNELIKALGFLNLPINEEKDLASGHVDDILKWAITHWSLKTIPKHTNIEIAP